MDAPTYCKKCNVTLPTWRAYQIHKQNSNVHLSCIVCDADFKNPDGLARHCKLAHAEEQKLICPGCDTKFTRLGALMGHIETGQCAQIHQKYEENKVAISQSASQFDATRAAHDWGSVNDNITIESTSTVDDAQAKSGVTLQETRIQPSSAHSSIKSQHFLTDSGPPKEGSLLEEDLMAFDILNESWEEDGPFNMIANDFKHAEAFPPLVPLNATSHAGDIGGPRTKKTEDHALANITNGNIDIVQNYGTPLQGEIAARTMKQEISPLIAAQAMDRAIQTRSPLTSTTSINPKVPVTSSSVDAITKSDFPALKSPLVATSTRAHVAAPENTPWSNQQKAPFTKTPVAASTLSAWSAPRSLFPDAPAAVAPPADLLATMSIGVDKTSRTLQGEAFSLHDPDAPGFNARRYFVTFTQKYKCPHLGCTKSVTTPGAFVQHLKAPAHIATNQRLKCINCLRFFESATALTQHVEAQGVRCNVRETSEYNTYVKEITAKAATIDGFHYDNTVKYTISEDFRLAKNVVQKKATNDEASKKQIQWREDFWKNEKPIW